PPTGPGVRVDTFGRAGYTTSPRFDSLLAKVIVHVDGAWDAAAAKAARALGEFRIDGVATNLSLLQALLRHPDVTANRVHTRFVEEHAAELAAATPKPSVRATALAGARIDTIDPLGVLHHGKSTPIPTDAGDLPPDDDTPGTVRAALQGTI